MIPANLEVVTIRYIEAADHASYVALEHDAAVKLYVNGPSPKTEQELRGDLHRYHPTIELMAIVDTTSNLFVGRCGLLPIKDSFESEIYCLLAESHWGKGIGEIVVSFLARLASQQGRVAVGIVHPDNKRSLAILRKLDWVADGVIFAPGKQQGHFRYVKRCD